MISRPFLTDLDSRAAIKGSRDPLGIQSIWTRFGRHVVGNLSTVSNSVRDFTIVILGYYFAEQVAEKVGPGKDVETFLKWEQLAGYARASVNGERGFRGTDRVWLNLGEPTVTLSAEARYQILSSQKLYGLWGLYTVPARSSDFLDGVPARLTPPARQMVEEFYLPCLTRAGFKDGKQIIELLARDRQRLDVRGGDRRLLAGVAGLLTSKFGSRERSFYRDYLLYGGPQDSTEGRQRQFAELLQPKLESTWFPWSAPRLRDLAHETQRGGEPFQPLATYLQRIATAETVLAPASDLFIHLLGCHDMKVSDLLKRIQAAWGSRVSTITIDEFAALKNELGGNDEAAGERWLAIGQAMSEGDYAALIQLLLAQNKAVMQARGGAAAWMEMQNKKLHVRMAEERGGLPSREELLTLWRFPYFLNSLCAVAFVLKEEAHD